MIGELLYDRMLYDHTTLIWWAFITYIYDICDKFVLTRKWYLNYLQVIKWKQKQKWYLNSLQVIKWKQKQKSYSIVKPKAKPR